MENAIAGDWLTPKLMKMLRERVARVIRNGFGEVSIVIIKGQVIRLKTMEEETINQVAKEREERI